MLAILPYFVAGLAYRCVMSLHGIDHIDLGFCHTYYQNFFSHPDALIYNHLYYLTGFVGGLIEQGLDAGGLLVFRMFEALMLTGAIFFLWLAARPWLSRRWAIAAVLLSFLFPPVIITFHHNTLSFLLCAMAIWCSVRGWQSQKWGWWVFAAGVIWGIAFFARLVNASWISLVVVFFFHGYVRGKWRMALTEAAVWLGGVAVGVGLVLGVLMPSLGHTPYFFECVADAFGIFSGGNTAPSHTGGSLFAVYFKTLLNLLLQMVAVAAMWFVFVRSARWKRPVQIPVLLLLAVGYAVLVLTNNIRLTLLASCMLLCWPALKPVTPFTPSTPKFFILLSTLATLAFPFGSDLGIDHIFQWTAGLMIFPATLGAQVLSKDRRMKTALLVGYLIVAAAALWRMVSRAHWEENWRTEDTCQTQSPLLNAYVTEQHAAQLDSLMNYINANLAEGQPLFIVGQESELYYACHALPFIGITQMGHYEDDELARIIEQQRTKFALDPLIVVVSHGDDEEEVDAMREVVERYYNIGKTPKDSEKH